MVKIAHIYWWKDLRASGKKTMFSHILSEGLNEFETLHWACWQAAVFWLPLAQQEAAGWWAPPPAIPRLQLRNFMPSPTSSDFLVLRQQKTMTLARVLQACTKELGSPTGVLCDAVWEQQRCMAPLFALSSTEIVEASPPKTCRREMQNLPYTRGGNCSPG